MREILFRGKRLDNDEWIYGYYIHICPVSCQRSYIIPEYASALYALEVDHSTISQYTGMKDKNGKRIFEGDIIDCWSEGVNAKGIVQQRIDGLWIIHPAWQNHIVWGICPDKFGNTTVEIIGNIHDKPELLKEGADNG